MKWLQISLSPPSLPPSPLPPTHKPDLDAREAVVVDVVLLQDAASIVVEVDAHLLASVDAIVSEDRLTAGGDPHSSQSVGMDLVSLDQPSATVVLDGVLAR